MKKTLILVFAVLFCLSVVFAATGSLSDTAVVSVSLVNQDPDPALAGDVVEIRIGIENKGGDALNDVITELQPSYPFELVAGETAIKTVGTVSSYQYGENMKIIKYKIRTDRDATAGSYELKVNYYEKGGAAKTQRSLSVDIESRESAEVIYIDRVELIPGKITPMKFTINNVGSAPLRELTFKWENAEDIILPVGSDNTKYIKYIDIGGSEELEFNVIASANADPDLYKLDLSLTYADPITGEDTEISTKAGIYVGGATDFDAAFSGTSNGESSFSISNIGSVSASSVTVRIPDQQGWRVQGSNSVIIGNLNEGDYTIASFNLQPAAQFSGFQRNNQTARAQSETGVQRLRSNATLPNQKVKLEIVYTDSRGNRNTIGKEVAIDLTSLQTIGTSSTSSASASSFTVGRRQRQSVWLQVWNTGKWILLGAVIITLFIVVRKKHHKGRLKDPKYTYMQTLKDMFMKKKL